MEFSVWPIQTTPTLHLISGFQSSRFNYKRPIRVFPFYEEINTRLKCQRNNRWSNNFISPRRSRRSTVKNIVYLTFSSTSPRRARSNVPKVSSSSLVSVLTCIFNSVKAQTNHKNTSKHVVAQEFLPVNYSLKQTWPTYLKHTGERSKQNNSHLRSAI